MKYLLFISGLLFFDLSSYSQTVEEFKKSAVEKADSKNYLGAIEDYTKALEINPRDTGAYFDRGMVKEYAGDLMGAIKDFSLAANLDTTSPDNFYLRGLVWEKLHNYPSAISDYKKALLLEPGNADAEFHWGICLLKVNEKLNALEHFNKSIELNTDQSEARVERAMLDLKKSSAVTDLQKAIEKDPQLTRPYYCLGIYYLNNNNYNEAVKQLLVYAEKTDYPPDSLDLEVSRRSSLRKALQANFENSVRNNKLDLSFARIWYSLGDYKKCISLCNLILATENNNLKVLFLRGLCEEKTKKYKAAMASFASVAAQDPRITEAFVHSAQLKFKSKLIDGAISDITKAISSEPFNAYFFYLRGSYFIAKANAKSGCEDFSKAKDFGINYLYPKVNLACN